MDRVNQINLNLDPMIIFTYICSERMPANAFFLSILHTNNAITKILIVLDDQITSNK